MYKRQRSFKKLFGLEITVSHHIEEPLMINS